MLHAIFTTEYIVKPLKSYMPEFMGVLLAILLLNVWYLSSFAIESRVIPKNYDYIINAVIVVSAAFFGSFSAFQLNANKQERIERKNKVDKINSTLFRLMRQFNAIARERVELEKFKNQRERCFKLPASLANIHDEVKYNISEIEFLLSGSDKQLLLDLAIEQERFHVTVQAINLRTDYHFSKIQPALEAINFSAASPTYIQFSKAVGPTLMFGLINHTDQVYFHVYKTCDSIEIIQERLLKVAKEMFPGNNFLEFK